MGKSMQNYFCEDLNYCCLWTQDLRLMKKWFRSFQEIRGSNHHPPQ